ncbi:hypothetical protein [Rossellomorea aquimaris]|uniref:hypothetical protein n=1 Tax=Rossellomorea aquimaris TaxID=189382 RepID=UPI0007D0A5AD|nr:hypothetical protein [Rossellomorea aquimaris]
MKKISYFFITIFIGLGIISWKVGQVDKLNRIDVQEIHEEGSVNDVGMVIEEADLRSISFLLEQVNWENDSLAVNESTPHFSATFFYQKDKNMPERLIEYSIWFDLQNGQTILKKTDGVETYGVLEKEHAVKLHNYFNVWD